jgi:drug/metabolite transporter (DMT)-like permease
MTPLMRGILLTVASLLVFAISDTGVKHLVKDIPVLTVVVFRYAVALAFAAVLLLRMAPPYRLVTRHLPLHALRGVLLLSSSALNFAAMQKLQLAQTAAISFTIPLWVCALSVPLLGETVGLRRWAAVLVGFVGVLIIMRPGTAGFHPAMFLSLAAAFGGACYNIATRKAGGVDRAETSLVLANFFGLIAAIPLSAPGFAMPQGWAWIIIAFIGLGSAIGHLLLTEAHRLAPASAIAPFIYTQIIWMIIMGYLAFGDVPGLWTLVGAAVVVASGLYVFLRERALGKAFVETEPVA